MTLLLADELAAELRCSAQTVYRLAHQGDIPGICVGRSWRFDLEEVKAKLSAPPEVDPWVRKSGVTRRWAP
ncbi:MULTISPECIES: helix-turn-helix domain-containing protein [unclassified Microbacterium]|uniref:helix-turn-helix domain-containing protein n=1 Tax=unclassified Microbacterium TaxID=2609290 RepID=UPI00056C57A5|nr:MULTISPECIES: helix-turn-helix domain-containing protein [unclassified Microbacterium]